MASAGQKQLPVKLSSVVNASRYVPNTSSSSLIVAVRVRPLLKTENGKGKGKDIMRVMDKKVVLVLDPDESKDYLDQVQNRTKEKRYTFDVAFDPGATNVDVYNGTIRDLVVGVLYGINTTVFAYGATGSGKTYTMVGGPGDPGLMFLSLERIFAEQARLFADEDFEVHCSYLEVYNEVIYDLLIKNSGPLELREDPDQGVQVAGLKRINVKSAGDIMGLLEEGNKRRKTESTDANSQSSRSHAVLEIDVRRTPRNHYRVQQLCAKLALVDLAGSERAADTNNVGQKLRDGANINRSLLALANCINALGKPNANKAASYVPYRNSKLTRLLKDGLSGNSRTAMITTVSAAADQYHHSIGTLKYADRAKEIKTHVVQNVGTVESHVADYQRIIDNLQHEVQGLKEQLNERPRSSSLVGAVGASSTETDVLAFIDTLVQEMNDNIEERINLQKALFEIEDANIFNRYELKQLDEFLDAGQGNVKDIVEARDRRTDVLTTIKDNDKERDRFKAEISTNEEDRRSIQGRIDQLAQTNQNVAFLNLMSTFRLQAVRLQELKFQMAVRDQIIGEQRQVIANLWRILDKSGIGRERVLDIAKQEGIIMDGFLHFSEEAMGGAMRGPTPPHPASSSGRAAAHGGGHPQRGGHHDRGGGAAAATAAAPAGKLRVKVGAENGAAAGGHVSFSHDQLGTPSASLVGNRAKMRYRFWADYEGEGDEGFGIAGGAIGSPGGGGKHRRRPKKGASQSGVPSPGRGSGGAPPLAQEHSARELEGVGGHHHRRHQPRSARRGAAAPASDDAGAAEGARGRGGPPSEVVSGAVQRALAGVGNNVTCPPTVRQGRRAGQPMRTGSAATSDANIAFDLPNVQRYRSKCVGGAEEEAKGGGGGGSSGGVGAWGERRRRASDAWGDQQGHPPLAAPPLLPAPLNERLAKLKLKMGGRKTEEGGSMNLPVGANPAGGGLPPTGPPLPLSARSSRPISAASTGGDALDTEMKRPTAFPVAGNAPHHRPADRQRTPSPLPRPRVSSAGSVGRAVKGQ